MADVTFDIELNKMEVHNKKAEPWKVTLIDTGLNTMTGGRIKRIKVYVNNETFMVTYGDGVSNVNIANLVNYHKNHGKMGTMTAVHPSGRFGAIDFANENVIFSFKEKPKGDSAWINCGFFVFEPKIFDYIKGDSTIFEKEPLETIASENQLVAYKHDSFWKPMDTLRDKIDLEQHWASNTAEWKVW